jgi:hypothetical protein
VLDHDPGIGLNLPEDTFVWVVGAIRAVHHKDPAAAGLELELLERVREILRPPPARELIRLLERCKYSSARNGEHSFGANDSDWVIRLRHRQLPPGITPQTAFATLHEAFMDEKLRSFKPP